DLALVLDLANEEAVAEEVREGSSSERDASAGLARAEGSRLGADVLCPEVPDQLVDAAYLEISAKDQLYAFGFLLDDDRCAVLEVIAKGQGASHPNPLALGGGDLVADALRGDLALELGKGQENVEGQPTHRRRRVELLGDGDKGDVMGIEQFDQFCEVGQRSGQPIDLVDDDDVDLPATDIVQKLLQVRTIG